MRNTGDTSIKDTTHHLKEEFLLKISDTIEITMNIVLLIGRNATILIQRFICFYDTEDVVDCTNPMLM